jgi:hypothetical protein
MFFFFLHAVVRMRLDGATVAMFLKLYVNVVILACHAR